MARNRKDEQDEDPRKFGIRKLSMLLFGLVMLAVVGCATFVSIHFNDPKWFEYGVGSVFTALVLVALFGWPIED